MLPDGNQQFDPEKKGICFEVGLATPNPEDVIKAKQGSFRLAFSSNNQKEKAALRRLFQKINLNII